MKKSKKTPFLQLKTKI